MDRRVKRIKHPHGGRVWHLGTKKGGPAVCGYNPRKWWTHDTRREDIEWWLDQYKDNVCVACLKKAGVSTMR